jgi:hypothetical protein
MMDRESLERAIASLESQRAELGDVVVELALAPSPRCSLPPRATLRYNAV